MEASEDLRFNYQLATSCMLDKQVFCRDVKPGQVRGGEGAGLAGVSVLHY